MGKSHQGKRGKRAFLDLPITSKLTAIIMATSAAALVLASSAILINELLSFRRSSVGDLSTLASVVGMNSYPALIFYDRYAAEENMSTLRSEPSVIAAYIYDRDGKLFAQYQNDSLTAPPPRPCSEQHPFLGSRLSPEAVPIAGHQFCRHHLDLFRPIVSDDEVLGTVYIQGDLRELSQTLWRYFGIVGVVMVGAFVVAFVMSSYLQRIISKPIVDLARMMRMVSYGGDYSVRAESAGSDEVGNLIDGFNQMLGQISSRDEQLELYRDHLEEQVANRTLELAKARDEALAASRAKSTFVASMSHEIRTPLHAILGHAQLLLRASNLSPGQLESLATIEASGDHLLALINSILDLSKIEVGAMEVQASEFDLTELLADLSAMFRVRCIEKGVSWRLEIAGDEGRICIRADANKLRRILINLVGNAVKFTDAGEVRLRVVHTRNRFTFEVSDTGPGISKEEKARLADPFLQGQAGARKGGTGLGLAIAKRLIELMGGTIEIDSALGRGAKFSFALYLPPAEGCDLVEGGPPLLAMPRLPDGISVSILVVDDIEENIDVLSRILNELGAEVREARDGREALQRIHEQVPDIVFMDIRMPVMSGLEALDEIKQDFGSDAIKCIAVTASSLSEERKRLLDAGFVDYISKPFRFEEVYECVSRHLGVSYDYQDELVVPADLAGTLPDCSQLHLPPDLVAAMTAAAELYQVSDLEDRLSELEALGTEELRLAEYLRALLHQFDLPAIVRVLKRTSQHEQPASTG